MGITGPKADPNSTEAPEPCKAGVAVTDMMTGTLIENIKLPAARWSQRFHQLVIFLAKHFAKLAFCDRCVPYSQDSGGLPLEPLLN